MARSTRTERALEEKLARDPHRPCYHFLPPSGWMNDPNGLIHWKGHYHLFYQYNPNGPFHDTIHWGHAVSDDLVHWTDLPIALSPTPGGPDQDGCFTGCAIDDGGTPTLLYTGMKGKSQLPCLATSTDRNLLTTWEKYPGNPIIDSPPKDLDVVEFRDHCVWKEDETWYQLIGSGIKGVGGTALLYSSPDLIHWDYLHPLHVGSANDDIWTGTMWECPEFFALGDKHVLVVSVYDDGILYYTVYFIGNYENQRFTPETQGMVDHGSHFYALQSMSDGKGRRVMFGWLREGRTETTVKDSGWAGVMSLPRVLSLHPGGSLGMQPAPELETLRGRHHRFADILLTPESSHVLEGIRGKHLEIAAEFEPDDAKEFGIKVRCSPRREEETLIVHDRVGRVYVDRSRSGAKTGTSGTGGSPTVISANAPNLHVYLDRCVVEAFSNDSACVTELVYPSRPDSMEVDLFTRGGKCRLKSLDIWELSPIWLDR